MTKLKASTVITWDWESPSGGSPIVIEQRPFRVDAPTTTPSSINEGVAMTPFEIAEAYNIPYSTSPTTDTHVVDYDPNSAYPGDPISTLYSDRWSEIAELYYSQCQGSPQTGFTAVIYVFKLAANLPYTIKATWGTFNPTQPTIVSMTKEDSYTFNGTDYVDLGYKVSNQSYVWEMPVYDTMGNILNNVTLDLVDDQYLRTSNRQEIYSTVRVNFKALADTWLLDITPRPGSSLNPFASTVFVFHATGTEVHEVKEPDFSEKCRHPASKWEVKHPTSAQVPQYEVTFQAFDYCTGDPVTGFNVYVDGNQVSPTGGAIFPAGTHSIRITASGYKDTDADDLDENDEFTLS